MCGVTIKGNCYSPLLGFLLLRIPLQFCLVTRSSGSCSGGGTGPGAIGHSVNPADVGANCTARAVKCKRNTSLKEPARHGCRV